MYRDLNCSFFKVLVTVIADGIYQISIRENKNVIQSHHCMNVNSISFPLNSCEEPSIKFREKT